jgi:hypothetical protein
MLLLGRIVPASRLGEVGALACGGCVEKWARWAGGAADDGSAARLRCRAWTGPRQRRPRGTDGSSTAPGAMRARSPPSSSRIGQSSTLIATGCSARSTTPRTRSRTPCCAPGADCRGSRGPGACAPGCTASLPTSASTPSPDAASAGARWTPARRRAPRCPHPRGCCSNRCGRPLSRRAAARAQPAGHPARPRRREAARHRRALHRRVGAGRCRRPRRPAGRGRHARHAAVGHLVERPRHHRRLREAR